jgi:hypothetical protein
LLLENPVPNRTGRQGAAGSPVRESDRGDWAA